MSEPVTCRGVHGPNPTVTSFALDGSAPGAHWAVVLCRWSDVSAVPRPKEFYQSYFTDVAAGGVARYWRDITEGAIDTSQFQVFGWLDMRLSSGVLATMTFPADRGRLLELCAAEAVLRGVPVIGFDRVVYITNVSHDSGATGHPGDIIIGHGDPSHLDLGFVVHEMGHGFGLEDSWSCNPDDQYGDSFDLMSFATSTPNFFYDVLGCGGAATCGLNAVHLTALGSGGPPASFTLRDAGVTPGTDFVSPTPVIPVNHTPRDVGTTGAVLWISVDQRDGNHYSFEVRVKDQWDVAIEVGQVLVVHQVRDDGSKYGFTYQWPTRKAYFKTGETVLLDDPLVGVTLAGWHGNVADVWVWDFPEGSLRQQDGDPAVYVMQKGVRRAADAATVEHIEQSGRVVRAVPANALAQIPLGRPMRAECGVLASKIQGLSLEIADLQSQLKGGGGDKDSLAEQIRDDQQQIQELRQQQVALGC